MMKNQNRSYQNMWWAGHSTLPKKNEIFFLISALAPKKRMDKKNRVWEKFEEKIG